MKVISFPFLKQQKIAKVEASDPYVNPWLQILQSINVAALILFVKVMTLDKIEFALS